ncbi:MAG: Ig-like domain-containing protein [Candidatus Kaiserbacteria bacterium]|nr:Ig-like domain-containing protein [Candidatus Kaiserbacteria bacterium]
MRIFFIAFSVLFLFPIATHAADASTTDSTSSLQAPAAGFATAPLWISKASPIDGDALKLFAVVNNASSATVSDTVSFLVDGTAVGSAKVSLDAGAAQIVSTAWTAVAGTHSLTATFFGTAAGPFSIMVAEAPPKPVVLQYLDTAMNTGSSALSGALAAVDSARQSGADYFAKQIGLGTTSPAQQGQVLGAATENLAKAGAAAVTAATSHGSLFDRLAYFFFQNPIIFYPALIILVFVVLWILSCVFSRK